MPELAPTILSNPVWHALRGPQRRLAIVAGGACRYPADVAPFAAIGAPDATALEDLRRLLAPAESVWMLDHGLTVAGLEVVDRLECLQLMLNRHAELPPPAGEVLTLGAAEAPEMVALTAAAFPGFFRPRTPVMGYYCGVRANGELVAMGGERLRPEGYPELSAICTHPAYRGRGFAHDILSHLVGRHRGQGERSWLYVGVPNTRAIDLYASLGFERVHAIMLHRLVRTA